MIMQGSSTVDVTPSLNNKQIKVEDGSIGLIRRHHGPRLRSFLVSHRKTSAKARCTCAHFSHHLDARMQPAASAGKRAPSILASETCNYNYQNLASLGSVRFFEFCCNSSAVGPS